jgi:hypothetical protein
VLLPFTINLQKLMGENSGSLSLSGLQFHSAFHLPQGETLGAVGAQPEVFNSFVLVLIFCRESKKPAAIESHECLSALRIGTLRDHESVAAANLLDAGRRRNVAHDRKLPHSSAYFGCPQNQNLIPMSAIHIQLG